jgi:hypothetical protein
MKDHIRELLEPIMGDHLFGAEYWRSDDPDDKCIIGQLHRLAKTVEFMCSLDQAENLSALKRLRREINSIATEISAAVKIAEGRAKAVR